MNLSSEFTKTNISDPYVSTPDKNLKKCKCYLYSDKIDAEARIVPGWNISLNILINIRKKLAI